MAAHFRRRRDLLRRLDRAKGPAYVRHSRELRVPEAPCAPVPAVEAKPGNTVRPPEVWLQELVRLTCSFGKGTQHDWSNTCQDVCDYRTCLGF